MLPGKKYGLPDYLALAKRHWWIVVACTAVSTFAALVVSATQKDTFQSDMLVQIVPQGLPRNFVETTITARTEERMASLEAQVKSRSELERLIREFNLYPNELAQQPMDDVVAKMRDAIRIELIRPMRHMPAEAFYVRFIYEDPDLAARVTSSLGQLFTAQNAIWRGKQAEQANAFLETQVAEAKTRLEAQEQRVERFMQQNAGRLPTQSQFNMQAMQSTSQQLQSLVESVARDRDRRLMLERMYADALNEPVPAAPAAATPVTGDAAAMQPLKQQLQAARAALTRLEARLKPEHPDLRRQRAVVTDLEAKVEAEAASGPAAPPVVASAEELRRREQLREQKAQIDSLERQITFKEGEEQRLRGVIADYSRRLEAVPGVESDYIALTRDYNTLRASYETLLRKSEDAKVASDLEKRQVGEQFKIVDPARVPVRPIGPFRLQINAVGFGAGLGIGVAIVVLLFFLDTTFRSEADVLDVLALPVLAIVPFVPDSKEQQRRQWRRVAVATVVAAATVGAGYVAWTMKLWRFVA